jgi:hypothetical protein
MSRSQVRLAIELQFCPRGNHNRRARRPAADAPVRFSPANSLPAGQVKRILKGESSLNSAFLGCQQHALT